MLLYSKKYNYCLKYHPKSGCSTLRIIFLECHRNELRRKHQKCDHHKIVKLFKKPNGTLPIFTLNIVRNPYERLVSTFTNKVCGGEPNNVIGKKLNLSENTFYHFVSFLLRIHRRRKIKLSRVDDHLARQLDDYSENDIIVKLENLEQELISHYDRPETQDLLPIIKKYINNRYNQSSRDNQHRQFVGMKAYSIDFRGPWSNYKYFYNEEIKNMIDEIYDKEFRIFGYPKIL